VRSINSSELVVVREPALRVATADVVRLEFPNRAAAPPRASLIQLANGDRIVAGLSSMSDEAVVALWKSYPDLAPVQIPAAAVAGILVSVPESVAGQTRAFGQVFGRREKSDIVLLVNGDRLAAIWRHSIKRPSNSRKRGKSCRSNCRACGASHSAPN